jgi:PAS domain S-box-containing protein
MTMQPADARLMRSVASRTAGQDLARAAADPSHIVQFYENEHFLAAAVADFLAAGLAAGQPLIVIATEPHHEAFSVRLKSKGFDIEHACGSGQLTSLDARPTLTAIMAGSMPDGQRLRATVGSAIERSLRGRNGAAACLYGEMVDLLWQDGNTEGAVRLEELWNELASTHSFSLLCVYAMGNFYQEVHAHHFREICRQHAHVIPTERYTQADDEARLVEISVLQQRAGALETEIEHRKELERRLCEALTERRRAEEAVRRSEQELKDFLENAVEGIHWVGPDGIIIWANTAELDLLGYSPPEYVGHHIAEFHADRSLIEDVLVRLAGHETLRDYEARLRCKDGSIRHVLINSNVLWRDGKFVHARCLTRDITDLKHAAAEHERLLAREQAARTEAETANRAKSEFLAAMSHELRTPLNAIGGYVQLIEMGVHGPVNDAQRAALLRVQRSQRHLLSLINDVLNLVRIETGHIEYVLEDVPLVPLLTDVTSMVEPLLSAKYLTCEIAPPSRGTANAVIAVRADREKVQQILLNLLTNAIKFTPAGGHIMVDAAPSPEALTMACVHVRDTGIGIPAAKLERIFEPFVQLGTRPAGQQDGVGLGLAISRDLARGMDGDLTAASAVGEGATFTLTLPGV